MPGGGGLGVEGPKTAEGRRDAGGGGRVVAVLDRHRPGTLRLGSPKGPKGRGDRGLRRESSRAQQEPQKLCPWDVIGAFELGLPLKLIAYHKNYVLPSMPLQICRKVCPVVRYQGEKMNQKLGTRIPDIGVAEVSPLSCLFYTGVWVGKPCLSRDGFSIPLTGI